MGSDAMRKLASDGDRRYREYMEEASTAIKFSDLPVPDVNPFRFRLRDKMNIQRVVKGAYNGVRSVDIIDRMSGEVVSGAEENRVFVKRESVDNDKFVKLYSDRIKAMFDLIL
jgi:hypothetical protein